MPTIRRNHSTPWNVRNLKSVQEELTGEKYYRIWRHNVLTSSSDIPSIVSTCTSSLEIITKDPDTMIREFG